MIIKNDFYSDIKGLVVNMLHCSAESSPGSKIVVFFYFWFCLFLIFFFFSIPLTINKKYFLIFMALLDLMYFSELTFSS